MKQEKASPSLSPIRRGWLIVIGILAMILCLLVYPRMGLSYTETKGPLKNWTQVTCSGPRWRSRRDCQPYPVEAVDESWAGIGRWFNLGNGTFKLVREAEPNTFGGFAAGVGDVDQDGDEDVFVQVFGIRSASKPRGAARRRTRHIFAERRDQFTTYV